MVSETVAKFAGFLLLIVALSYILSSQIGLAMIVTMIVFFLLSLLIRKFSKLIFFSIWLLLAAGAFLSYSGVSFSYLNFINLVLVINILLAVLGIWALKSGAKLGGGLMILAAIAIILMNFFGLLSFLGEGIQAFNDLIFSIPFLLQGILILSGILIIISPGAINKIFGIAIILIGGVRTAEYFGLSIGFLSTALNDTFLIFILLIISLIILLKGTRIGSYGISGRGEEIYQKDIKNLPEFQRQRAAKRARHQQAKAARKTRHQQQKQAQQPQQVKQQAQTVRSINRTHAALQSKYNYYQNAAVQAIKLAGGHIPKKGTREYQVWKRATQGVKIIEKEARKRKFKLN